MFKILAGLLFFCPAWLWGQASISTDTVVQTSNCPGGYLLVPFTVTNPNFNSGNRFYAQWSNAFGSFSDPDTIGSTGFIFGGKGIIFTSIPEDAGFGLLYRVRVVASDPPVTGSQSPLPIFVTAINFSADISANPSDPQCEGEPVTLTAGLGIGGTYAWSNGETTGSIEVDQPGIYSVTVTTLGCDVASDPYELDMLPLPARPEIDVLPGGDLQSSPEAGYQWMLNGFPIPGATSASYAPSQTGRYSVMVFSDDGCRSEASPSVFHLSKEGSVLLQEYTPYRDTITHIQPAVVNPDTTTPIDPVDYSVRVYPNPANDYLVVETITQKAEKIFFVIFDATGREMYRSPRLDILGSYRHEVDLSAFPAGIYNLHLFVRGNLRNLNIQKR